MGMLYPKLATQGPFIGKSEVKAKRAEHLCFEIVVGSLKVLTQMLNPYKFVVVNY